MELEQPNISEASKLTSQPPQEKPSKILNTSREAELTELSSEHKLILEDRLDRYVIRNQKRNRASR